MSITNYINFRDIIQSNNPLDGKRFTEDEFKLLNGILSKTSFGRYTNYSDSEGIKDVVELHVYSRDGKYIDSDHNVTTWDTKVIDHIGGTVHDDIRKLGLNRGRYKIVYNFLRNHVSSKEAYDKLFIYDISPSRLELKVRLTNVNNKLLSNQLTHYVNNIFKPSTYYPLHQLNFGDNKIINFINIIQSSPTEVYIKLDKPLPNNIVKGTSCWIVGELRDSYIDNINLIPLVDDIPKSTLRGPNFEIDNEYDISSETGLKNWNDLLTTNTQTSQRLIDNQFSGSLDLINLNINYCNFEEFVHFSSAEERVKNFVYKLKLIEYYDERLQQLDNITGSVETNTIDTIILKNGVISSFDNFEKWLYFNPTGSLYTHSTGSCDISPYPKELPTSSTSTFTWQTAWQTWYEANIAFESGSGVINPPQYPYSLYSTTSTVGRNWIIDTIQKSIEYDRNNIHKLRNYLPSHMLDNSSNDQGILFTDMLGHHFDINWTYINQLYKLHSKEEHPDEGVSPDLLYSIAESFGWKLSNGTNNSELWEYVFGTDEDNNRLQSGSVGVRTKPYEYRTKEIWKRIVNNLPYILKTKGTERSVKALISCYGIPNTILFSREYGGPSHSDVDTDFKQSRYLKKTLLTGNEQIRIPYKQYHHVDKGLDIYPTTIEMTVGTNNYTSFDYSNYGKYQIFLHVDGLDVTRGVLIEPTTGVYCNIHYIYNYNSQLISSSINNLPLLDGGEFTLHMSQDIINPITNVDPIKTSLEIRKSKWNKLVVNTGSTVVLSGSHFLQDKLFADKLYTDGEIVFGTNVNIYNSPGNSLSGNANFFTGSIREVRYYIDSLNNSSKDNHSLSVRAYNSNSPTGAFYDVVNRIELTDEFYDYSTGSFIIRSTHPNQLVTQSVDGTELTASMTGFTTSSIVGDVKDVSYDVISGGTNSYKSTKIRIEDQTLLSNLSSTKRSTISQFDYEPIDNNRLTVAFSPQHVINEDILSHIGKANLGNYIGDPTDVYTEEYNDLTKFSKHYWKKYKNKNDFISLFKLLSIYDFSIFTQIQQVLPHRTNKTLGILIEPNLLERSKIRSTGIVNVIETDKLKVDLNLKPNKITSNTNNYFSSSLKYNDLHQLKGNTNGDLIGNLLLKNNTTFKSSTSHISEGLLQLNTNKLYSFIRNYNSCISTNFTSSINCFKGIRYVKGEDDGYGLNWKETTQPQHKCSVVQTFITDYITYNFWLKYNYIFSTSESKSLGLYESRSYEDSSYIPYDDLNTSTRNNRYDGCIISGFINIPNSTIPENSPVVESIQVSPNELQYKGETGTDGTLDVV